MTLAKDNGFPPTLTSPREARAGTTVARKVATLLAACAGVAVAQLANAIPATLNGTFQAYFQTSGSQLTWITTAFMIPVVVFELTFGVLGDLYGRRRLLFAGAALVVAGSIVSALAPVVQTLWVGAALNGLGAGILFPISLTLVAAVTPTPAERARAIALWAGSLSAGAAVSPLVAGTLAARGLWQGSYWLVAVLAAATFVLALRAAESAAPHGRRLDVPGQVTFALGLVAVLYAAVQGAEIGWGRPLIVAAFAAGAALLVVFVLVERRSASPILHLDLFRNRSFAVVAAVAVVGMFAFLGICFSTSMWMGPVQHQPALLIGILFLFLQGPAFVLIPVVSRLVHEVPPRWPLTAGFLLMAAAGFVASTFDVQDGSWTRFVLPALLTGVGFALTISSVTAVAINTVPHHLAGMASATTNLLRDLGMALGPVLVGAIALGSARGTTLAQLPGLGLPADVTGQVTGIAQQGGAVALNSIPELPDAVHAVALTALGHGFNLAYLVCAVAALVAAVLTFVGLAGVRHHHAAAASPSAADAGTVD